MFYDDTKELYFIKSKFQEHALTKILEIKTVVIRSKH